MKKIYVFLGLIVLLAAFLRLPFLNNVPNSITNDQTYYILNAKSFLATGADLSGSVNPFQLFLFQYPSVGMVQAELPFFLQFPLLSFLPMSLAAVILPNALLSIATVLLFFLIGKKLFDQKTALFISFAAAINPWFIFTGRTVYEIVPAVFFYLCGFYILLIAKKWKILWAFPFFLLAFYSYIGTKLLFLPFIVLMVIYCYFVVHKKQYAKHYLTLIGLACVTVFFFFFQLQHQPTASRLSEIITPDNAYIVSQVDGVRKQSMQNPVTTLFENKMTDYSRIIILNFFNIFNPSYLFANGDTFFSLYRHGLFYMVDLVFLLIGSFWLYTRKNKLFLFFLFGILLSTIPQIIHDPQAGGNFTPHITLLFPFFIMLIGVGITKVTEIPQKSFRIGALFLVGILYLFSLGNFLNVYFYQFPLQTGVFDFSSRVLSRYLTLAQEQNQQVTVYSVSSEIIFKKYLFYSNSYTNSSAKTINQSFQTKNFTMQNVHFVGCPSLDHPITTEGIAIVDTLCGLMPDGESNKIGQLKDSGATFHIYNDEICSTYSLKPYIAWLKLQDLTVEKLDAKSFCETFIIH